MGYLQSQTDLYSSAAWGKSHQRGPSLIHQMPPCWVCPAVNAGGHLQHNRTKQEMSSSRSGVVPELPKLVNRCRKHSDEIQLTCGHLLRLAVDLEHDGLAAETRLPLQIYRSAPSTTPRRGSVCLLPERCRSALHTRTTGGRETGLSSWGLLKGIFVLSPCYQLKWTIIIRFVSCGK